MLRTQIALAVVRDALLVVLLGAIVAAGVAYLVARPAPAVPVAPAVQPCQVPQPGFVPGCGS